MPDQPGGARVIPRNEEMARNKVRALPVLAEIVQLRKAQGATVGLCHGCFDILHAGHLRHFEAAAALVDILIVTVTPDRLVNKGPNRPVFPEGQRAELIAGLAVVDWVGINEWPSAVETIRLLKPNAFIKGEEYETRAMQVNPNFVAESRVIEEIGGKVIYTRVMTLSSTIAFNRLKAQSE